MDINKWEYSEELKRLFQDIADAHFVSFDFEFSGIHQRLKDRKREKQSLEERYQQARNAAQTYTILQVGLTMVIQNPQTGSFELKPYNFPLSPLFRDKRMDINRHTVMQSSAMEFLLQHGFDIDAPFRSGVPYLSRSEEVTVRAQYIASLDKSKIRDIEISESDTSALEFLAAVRAKIDDWEATTFSNYMIGVKMSGGLRLPKKQEDRPPSLYLRPRELRPIQNSHSSIGGDKNGSKLSSESSADGQTFIDKRSYPEFSAFHRRLIYQTVRNEYSHLVVFPRDGAMRVNFKDEAYEAELSSRREQEIEPNMMQQIGLRWLFEALCANAEKTDPDPTSEEPDLPQTRLDKIMPGYFTVAHNGNDIVFKPDDEQYKEWYWLRHKLIYRPPPVFVGHNCFTDLVYMYVTSFGPLPPTAEAFASEIHKLFPFIIDTKFLAMSYLEEHTASVIRPNGRKSKEPMPPNELPNFAAHSSLTEIVESLECITSPNITVHENHAKYLMGTSQAHEAGYDSMITAQLLIRLSALLYSKFPVTSPRCPPPAVAEVDNAPLYPFRPDDTLKRPNMVAEQSPDCQVNRHVTTSNRYDALGLENESGESEELVGGREIVGGNEESSALVMPDFTKEKFWSLLGNRLRVTGTKEETLFLM